MTQSRNATRRLILSLAILIIVLGVVRWLSPESAAAPASGPCAVPNFGPPALFNATNASAIAVGDLNVDGKNDMAVVNGARPGRITILLGDGSGGFSSAGTVPTGAFPLSVAIADFNSDGKPDLVTANADPTDGEATILLGRGDGSFGTPSPLSWTPAGFTRNAQSVTVADFNADGKADVAVATNLGFIRTALGDGLGNFTNLRSVSSGGSFPRHIIAKDLNSDGKPDLAVANGGSSHNLAVLLGDGSGAFSAPTTFAAGASPIFLAAADLNADGKPDMAVADSSSQNVSILFGDGAGGVGAAHSFAGGDTSRGVAADDFNGDGKIDLVLLNYPAGTAVILAGDGSGNFTAAANYFTGTPAAKFIALGDFNGDGQSDLAAAQDSAGRIAVLLNTCGSQPAQATLRLSADSYILFEDSGTVVLYAVVLRNGPLAGSASVHYATNDGTAQSPADYTATAGTLTLAAGETFKSITLPIIDDALDEPDENFTITLSNATGAAILGSPSVAQVLVLDNDPAPRLSVSDASVLEGNTGTVNMLFTVSLSAPSAFTVTTNYATADVLANMGVDYSSASGTLTFAPGETSKAVAVAVNGDTLEEVNEHFFLNLSAPSMATIADGHGAGTILDDDAACPGPSFTAPTDLSMTAPFALTPADFNGDGKPDVAVANIFSGKVTVLPGAAAGGFGTATSLSVGASPRSLTVGDFNLDGRQDLAIAKSDVNFGDGVTILLGDGAGGFTAAPEVGAGPLPYYVTAGDFNRDDRPDLAVVNLSPGAVSILLGDGRGGFGPRTSYPVGTSPEFAAVGDFNNDGKPDVAVSNMNSNNVSVLLGNGAGGLAAAVNFPVGANPQGLAGGDFDGDGRQDLIVTNSGADSVSLLLGNGAGGFGAATDFAVGARPSFVAVADLNGDQRLDLVTANYQRSDFSTGDVSMLFGTGTGKFTLPVNIPVRQNPISVAVTDFNGDAKADVLVANLRSDSLSMLLNACNGQSGATIQFSAPSYEFGEGAGNASLTVTRSGGLSGTSTISYRTVDDQADIGCADRVNNHGAAYARCDYATTVGTLQFAPGETLKVITIPLIDDAYVEGPETFHIQLSDPSAGMTLGTPATATLTVLDNDISAGANPIFGSSFFVRMQYLDFLSREPDVGGFQAWLRVLNNCADVNNVDPNSASAACDRITVSSSFFGSQEFQLKGFYVFRFYRVAFGRLPTYAEIVPDMSYVSGSTAAEVYARKAQLATLFTQRQEFGTAYNALTNEQYVTTLLNRYQLTAITTPNPADPDGTNKMIIGRDELTAMLNANTLTRAQVLRAVADSDQVGAQEFNRAFVAMQYYGYLRRTPETDGYNAWLNYLNAHPADFRTMVNGFMNSQEYRLRFGGPNQ